MTKIDEKLTCHHIVPKSRGGNNSDCNIQMLKCNFHRSIHTLFANDIFPEQIERLTNMTSRVLRPEIVQELLEVLSYRDIHNPEERYKDGVLLLPKKYRCWRNDTDTE